MRASLLIAQAATMGLAGAADAVSRVGFPIFSSLALGAWSLYQDRQFRAERAAAELSFRDERKGDREAHLQALGQLGAAVDKLRDAVHRQAA